MGADVFMKIICLRRINTDKDEKAIFAVSGWLRSIFFGVILLIIGRSEAKPTWILNEIRARARGLRECHLLFLHVASSLCFS